MNTPYLQVRPNLDLPWSALLACLCLQEDIAVEAETGKVYRTTYHDKLGRPVLIMKVANQVRG